MTGRISSACEKGLRLMAQGMTGYAAGQALGETWDQDPPGYALSSVGEGQPHKRKRLPSEP